MFKTIRSNFEYFIHFDQLDDFAEFDEFELLDYFKLSVDVQSDRSFRVVSSTQIEFIESSIHTGVRIHEHFTIPIEVILLSTRWHIILCTVDHNLKNYLFEFYVFCVDKWYKKILICPALKKEKILLWWKFLDFHPWN